MECNYADTPIKATGAIEASLILTDGNDGTEYLLHTYKVKVPPSGR